MSSIHSNLVTYCTKVSTTAPTTATATAATTTAAATTTVTTTTASATARRATPGTASPRGGFGALQKRFGIRIHKVLSADGSQPQNSDRQGRQRYLVEKVVAHAGFVFLVRF